MTTPMRSAPQQAPAVLPRKLVAQRYHVSVKTVTRWEADPRLNFPKPIVIGVRVYFRERDLEAFDRRQPKRAIEPPCLVRARTARRAARALEAVGG